MDSNKNHMQLCRTQKSAMINSETLELYHKYEIHMSIKQLAEDTIKGYQGDLNLWFIYVFDFQKNKSITKINEDDITAFMYYCKNKGNGTERIKRLLAAISEFYKFLRRKRIINENPMEFIDRVKKGIPKRVQTYLTPEQVEFMKTKLKEEGNLQLETYALLSLSTMARVKAVSNIAWKQIDFESRTINDVIEKESKIVTLYFSQEVKDLLLRLKSCREIAHVNDKGWVFITNYREQINKAQKSTLQGWAKKIGKMIGVPTFHPHDFRHSMATILKNRGLEIEIISDLLNHNSIETTRKHYLRQDKKKMQMEKDKYEFVKEAI